MAGRASVIAGRWERQMATAGEGEKSRSESETQQHFEWHTMRAEAGRRRHAATLKATRATRSAAARAGGWV